MGVPKYAFSRSSSQIIFASALGFFVFADIPDLYSIIGYVIIVAMALVMFLYNNGKFKRDNGN